MIKRDFGSPYRCPKCGKSLFKASTFQGYTAFVDSKGIPHPNPKCFPNVENN